MTRVAAREIVETAGRARRRYGPWEGGSFVSSQYEPDDDPIVTADDIAEEASGQLVIDDEEE